MAITLEEVLRGYGVNVSPPGHKHTKDGWTHVCCPFCRPPDTGFHLGFADGVPVGRCFKCGRQNLGRAIMLLTGCTWLESKRYVDGIVGELVVVEVDQKEESTDPDEPLPSIELPHEAVRMREICRRHNAYLKERGFNPADVSTCWDLHATGTIGDHPWSIVIPVWDQRGNLVAWQARDITGTSDAKYRNPFGSVVRRVLYGLNKFTEDTRACIVCEGAFDVWRFGPGVAVHTFGQDFSVHQTMLLADRFDEVYVVYDPEPPAQKMADLLAGSLAALGTQARAIDVSEHFGLEKDPGDMTQPEANYVKAMLLG